MNDGTPIIIKKKKVVGHGGHHGGSWKVAYADFVTAMMAFFMVMWIMGLSDQTKALIQGYFNDPMGFTKNEPKAAVNVVQLTKGPPRTFPTPGTSTESNDNPSPKKSDEQEMRKLQKQLEDAVKSGGPGLSTLLEHMEFEITPEGLRIELIEASGAVFFDIGKSTIRPEARKLIARMEPLIVQANRGIVIEGHTDARPYVGTDYDNMDLSTDRARAMRHLLRDLGVPGERFLEVRGYGDKKLRKPEAPYDYSNRRVTILLPFKPFTSAEVGMPKDDLKSQIQGVFRRPVEVAPDKPSIQSDDNGR
jgi:chemotaxis protein MotB